ncbi:MAG: hypothetical protein ACRCVV_21765, partial [Shewanella sp.]
INTSLFKDTISLGDKDKVDQVIEGKVKVALIDISADEGTATYQDISATYNQASGEVRFTGLPSVVPIGKKMVVKYSLQTKVFDITLDDTIDNKVQVDINGDNTISDGIETSTASVKVTSKTDVTIDKASSTTLIGQGGTIFYTLTVTNTGNTPISNYILVDKPEPLKVDVTQDIGAIVILDGQVQTGATFKYDSAEKQFVLGGVKPTIPVGKSLVVNYSLKSLVFDATDNKISNTATVTVGDIIKNDVVNVGVDKNIAATLEKTTSTPIISQNGKATYTLTLTNTGNIPLIGYILEDTPNIDKVNLMTLSQVSIKLNGTSVTLPTDFKRDSETDPTKLIL